MGKSEVLKRTEKKLKEQKELNAELEKKIGNLEDLLKELNETLKNKNVEAGLMQDEIGKLKTVNRDLVENLAAQCVDTHERLDKYQQTSPVKKARAEACVEVPHIPSFRRSISEVSTSSEDEDNESSKNMFRPDEEKLQEIQQKVDEELEQISIQWRNSLEKHSEKTPKLKQKYRIKDFVYDVMKISFDANYLVGRKMTSQPSKTGNGYKEAMEPGDLKSIINLSISSWQSFPKVTKEEIEKATRKAIREFLSNKRKKDSIQ